MTETTDVTTAWIAADDTFGARLALVRQRMGWGNVKEAALSCGVPQESWRTWERDNVTPRDYFTACKKISERTGCDYGWLVDLRPTGWAWRERLPRVDSNHQPADWLTDSSPNGSPGYVERPTLGKTIPELRQAMRRGSTSHTAVIHSSDQLGQAASG